MVEDCTAVVWDFFDESVDKEELCELLHDDPSDDDDVLDVVDGEAFGKHPLLHVGFLSHLWVLPVWVSSCQVKL